MKRALFTNKLSHQWCQIIKHYFYTMFRACRYSSYELHKHACHCMDGNFVWFSRKWNVNLYIVLTPCASPNSNILTNFVCWSILVSEICVFNLKMNNLFSLCQQLKWTQFLIKLKYIYISVMMSLDVHNEGEN